MRLFGTLKNQLKGICEENIHLTFKIQTSFSPSNLWVVRYGDPKRGEKEEEYTEIHYRKIISVMYATCEYKEDVFYGKIISYADGIFGIREFLVLFDCTDGNYEFDQSDSLFRENNYTYFIDIDELRTHKEFSDLSLMDCLVKLKGIHKDDSDYCNMFNVFIYPNKVCTLKEHTRSNVHQHSW